MRIGGQDEVAKLVFLIYIYKACLPANADSEFESCLPGKQQTIFLLFSQKHKLKIKLEKITYPNSFSYFFLSSIYEVSDKVFLSNNFFKIAQLYKKKSCS